MKKCPRCGEENRDTVAFCTQCGSAFTAAPAAPAGGPPPAAPAASGPVLEIVQGTDTGRTIPVNGVLQIGRDPASGLILHDDLVSRRHLRVTADAHGLLIEDLGSRNGTFVNGSRVTQATRLRPGDRLTVGDTVLLVR